MNNQYQAQGHTFIYQAQIPPKVQAAMHFLSFCHAIRIGPPGMDGRHGEGRELSSPEKRAEDAALATLTEFFNSPGMGLEVPQMPPGFNPPQPPMFGVNAS